MKKGIAFYITILALFLGIFIFTGFTFSAIGFLVALLYGIISLGLLLVIKPILSAKITAPGEVEKGEVYRGRIRIKNNSSLPIIRLNISLSLKNLLTEREEGTIISKGLIPGGETIEKIEGESDTSGMLKLSIKEAFYSDLLGLFKRKADINSATSETLVLPVTEYVLLEPEDLERYDMESFRYADGKVGSDSSETVGIREYIQGDSIKGIHWKLTAKTGDIMVKEYGLPVDTKLMVIADKKIPKGQEEDRKDGIEKREETLAEYTLSVSKSLLEKEINHELGWYDTERERFERRTIGTWDDYQRMMRDFLSSGFLSKAQDTVKGFLESEGNKDFAGFLYITLDKEDTERIKALREYGNVAIYSPE